MPPIPPMPPIGGVEDTGIDHVDVLALGAVEALVEVGSVLVSELTNDNRALKTGVLDDGAGRAGDGVLDDADTELLVKVGSRDVVKGLSRGLDQGSTTTGEDTLLNSSTGGVQGIDESVLLLTDLDLGGATDLDDGDTARELSKALLELLLLVLGGGRVSDDTTDLLTSLSNGILAAVTVEDNGVLLGDGDGTGGAEHVGGGLVKLDVELIGEDGTVGEDGKIAEDGLAVVTEARGLDGSDLELATELVQDADSKSLALNVLSNDDERSSLLGGDLKSRDDVLDSRDLLLGKKDERVLELDLLGLGVGDEVRGDETTVESHALGDLELVSDGLALLAGDNTLLADLLHGVGDHLADVDVAVGRDGSDLSDLGAGGDITLVLLEELDDGLDGSLDTAAEVHGVAAGSNVLDGLGEDSTGENGSGGGTVTGDLVGLGGNILEELGTEVLELVLEAYSAGNGNTIWDWSVGTGLNEDVSALGAEGSSNSLSEGVDTGKESGTALNTELELLYSLLEENSITMTSQYHHTFSILHSITRNAAALELANHAVERRSLASFNSIRSLNKLLLLSHLLGLKSGVSVGESEGFFADDSSDPFEKLISLLLGSLVKSLLDGLGELLCQVVDELVGRGEVVGSCPVVLHLRPDDAVQLSEGGIVVLKVLSHGLVLLFKGASVLLESSGSLVEEAALSAAGEAPTLVQLVLLLDDTELLLEELVLLVGLPHGVLLKGIALLLKSTGMLLEITGMLLKGKSLLLKKASLLLKDLVLLPEITSILAKGASLLLESTDIHAKRSSGIGNTLLDGMLDHGAHVIVGVNKVLLNRVGNSAALEGSAGSVVVTLLSLDSLKVVVDTTGDFLVSLALTVCMALLDP
ncbi:hypothetical protein HG530_015843 [Fusarium avenaceum]|nr:hypothetical protein HG530_015843 [Fusarium avenaceum]